MSFQEPDGSLTALETAVLDAICRELPARDRAAFQEQLDGITVRERNNTGAGFYTYFALKSKSAQQIRVDTRACYIHAKVNGVDDALGFILWLEDGYIDFLEGYTLALDTTEGLDLGALEFELGAAPSPKWDEL